MSNDIAYVISPALIQRVVPTKIGDYAWLVILEHGYFQAQAVILFETEVLVSDAEWIGWLPGTGAVAKDIAPIPEEIESIIIADTDEE